MQPFGNVNGAVNDLGNNFRFAGQYYDSETGLHYNYHRYYDPNTGRYLTPDPIGLAGGINLFIYAGNNPINSIDPFGLFDWKDYSRSLSANGGVPPGIDPVPIPWAEYKQFGLLVGKQAVNYIINKYIPVEIQILDPKFFTPSPAEAAEIPSSPAGAIECY